MTALVIGASAAGLSTVEALRRKGYRDTIAVLGAELSWVTAYSEPRSLPPRAHWG
ncbi:hypothetical protein [Kribbella sp. NPDC049227]|uniref:hypothetical protein n=1 Tax=Kribbella sp. NPDC049227 TaxID=3364113 RepID=UPI00371DFCDC